MKVWIVKEGYEDEGENEGKVEGEGWDGMSCRRRV